MEVTCTILMVLKFNGNTLRNDSAFQYGYGYYALGYWNSVNNFNVTKNYMWR